MDCPFQDPANGKLFDRKVRCVAIRYVDRYLTNRLGNPTHQKGIRISPAQSCMRCPNVFPTWFWNWHIIMAPSGDTYNVDWILSTVSSAHCANHRDWFVSYKPFKSHAQASIGGRFDVAGVGDVELRVKKPNRNARPSYSIIWLEDVLYCPSALCNQVSIPSLVGSYGVSLRAEGGEISRDNVPIGIIDNPLLWKLRLSGQPPNQTCLDKNGLYSLSFFWSDEERARWGRLKAADLESQRSSQVPPFTDEEKEWLKKNWGGEFRFLRAHLLKIHDEDDRAEGRRIVRAMMHDSDDSDDSNDGDDDDGSFILSYTDGHGVKPIVPHADGHLVDYYFSENELIWIEKNFGNSASFLITYGLKFYNDDDCKEGKRIAQAMMRDDAWRINCVIVCGMNLLSVFKGSEGYDRYDAFVLASGFPYIQFNVALW